MYIVFTLNFTVVVDLQKSAQDIEREQEERLKAKYGGLQPKKKLLPKVCTQLMETFVVILSSQLVSLAWSDDTLYKQQDTNSCKGWESLEQHSFGLCRSTNSLTLLTGHYPSKEWSLNSNRLQQWLPTLSQNWRLLTISRLVELPTLERRVDPLLSFFTTRLLKAQQQRKQTMKLNMKEIPSNWSNPRQFSSFLVFAFAELTGMLVDNAVRSSSCTSRLSIVVGNTNCSSGPD